MAADPEHTRKPCSGVGGMQRLATKDAAAEGGEFGGSGWCRRWRRIATTVKDQILVTESGDTQQAEDVEARAAGLGGAGFFSGGWSTGPWDGEAEDFLPVVGGRGRETGRRSIFFAGGWWQGRRDA